MSLSDDDEIVFNRQTPSSFDDTPLPALTGKNPAASLMSQEDIDEDERLKREIWAEVEAAKAERLKREEEEKKRKRAERKKAQAARDSAGDSEVSQKVLEARKKREEERKKFRQLRMQGKQGKPAQSDLVVVSPVKSPAASRRPADTVEIVAAKPPPSSTRQPKPQPEPVMPEPEPTPEPEPEAPKMETPPPAAAKASTRRTLTPSGSDSAQKWKRAYMSVKSKYEAELEGKEKMEQALAQYDQTINTLMQQKNDQAAKIAALEQQGSTPGGSDSSERAVAAEAKEAATQAELEVVKAQYQQLKAQHDAHAATAAAEKTALKKRVESLELQVAAGGGGGDAVAEKLAKFQEASARHVQVLQLQVARFQSQNKTLQSQLDARSQENLDLTQICDQLVKMLEASQA